MSDSSSSSSSTSPLNVHDTLLNHLSQFPNAYKCWEMTRHSSQHPVESLAFHMGPEYKVVENDNNDSHSFAEIDGQLYPLAMRADNHCGMRMYRLMGEVSVPVNGRDMSFADACSDPNIVTTNCVSQLGNSHLIAFWDTSASSDTVPHTKYLSRVINKDGSLAPTVRAWATDESTGGPHVPGPNGPRFPIGAFAYELSLREADPCLPFERPLYGGMKTTDVTGFVNCLNSDLEHVFVRHSVPPRS